MKKFFLYYIFLTFFANYVYANNKTHQNYASLVVDANNGKVLHEEFADKSCYPASLTKMMTIYLALEAIEQGHKKFSDQLKISSYAAMQAPSKLGLHAGETISLENAIISLIVKSANDSAVVIAENISGSEKEFAKLMTKRAWQLGMSDTLFKNASGLPNAEQKTTAYDMAKLALALQRDFHKHYHLFAKTSFIHKGRKYKSHNHVLVKYPFANGLKTGYTNSAGFNLVTSAQKGGRKVVSVVMGGNTKNDRDYQMVQLLDKYLGTAYATIFKIDSKLTNNKSKIATQTAKKKLVVKVTEKNSKSKKKNVAIVNTASKNVKNNISKNNIASTNNKLAKNISKKTLSKTTKKTKVSKVI